METFRFIKTSTAGNRTGFVLSQKAFTKRKNIIKALLRNKNLEAEQYAFLWKESSGIRIEMAGGELCGGAILASPVLLSDMSTSRQLVISTGPFKLKSCVVFEKDKTWMNEVSLPSNILINAQNLVWKGMRGKQVVLDGIAYFVTEEATGMLDIQAYRDLDMRMDTQKIPALGIVEISDTNQIKPRIWVKDIGTIVAEEGCTTGSIVAQIYTGKKNGLWLQPSGKQIKVELGDEIRISAQVNILSEGKVYVSY